MPHALVIDDSRYTADTLCQMLELLGIQASVAYGPRDAFLEIRKDPLDIIFLDINMPGLDGFEVLSYIQREPHLKKIPVVIVTSDDQPETEIKARETGALKLMLKPVTVEALEHMLKQVKLVA
jgi:CheY-like chemotaxis protein